MVTLRGLALRLLMSPSRMLRAFGLSSLLLVTGCGQTNTAQHQSQTSGTSSPSPLASGRYATPKDAAIAAMVAKTGSTYREDGLCPSGQSCLSKAQVFGNTDPNAGLDAAYVQMGYGGQGGGAACFVYLFYEAGGWHSDPPIVCGQQGGSNPIMGYDDQVQVTGGGCANVRQQPSITAKVVACLKNGTTVSIDTTPPRYVDGHIWWSVNHQQGFMAHDVLVP
jgi:hypothetical protein